jgi:hypothetical protein
MRPRIADVAEAFVEQRQDQYRYGRLHRSQRRAWWVWDGESWQRDETLAIYDDACSFARNAGCRVTASCAERIVRRARTALWED